MKQFQQQLLVMTQPLQMWMCFANWLTTCPIPGFWRAPATPPTTPFPCLPPFTFSLAGQQHSPVRTCQVHRYKPVRTGAHRCAPGALLNTESGAHRCGPKRACHEPEF